MLMLHVHCQGPSQAMGATASSFKLGLGEMAKNPDKEEQPAATDQREEQDEEQEGEGEEEAPEIDLEVDPDAAGEVDDEEELPTATTGKQPIQMKKGGGHQTMDTKRKKKAA